MEHNSGSGRAGVSAERVWLGQEILEPTNEDRAWIGRSGWLSVSAVDAKNKNTAANPSGRFYKTSAKPQENFNSPINIYVTPDSFFVAKLREIFQKTKIRHTSASEAKRWLGGPHMNYWPQQLNFAVFCATQGCRISREIFDSGLKLTPQIRAFYQFHVYFKANLVPDGRYSEHKRCARRSNIQCNR